MISESFVVILPLPNRVLSPNFKVTSLRSRFMVAAATKRYRRLAKEAIQEMEIETIPWKQVTVASEFFFRRKRRRDEDNAMGWIKAAYDGIVDAGLVQDDDPEHMERSIPIISIDKEHPRVELTLTRSE